MDTTTSADPAARASRPPASPATHFIANVDRPGHVAPRREGKTLAVNMVMLEHCRATPGAQAMIISTSKRTSKNLLQKMIHVLVKEGVGDSIARPDEYTIEFRFPDAPEDSPPCRIEAAHGTPK
jgi:hypothetical protein